MDYGQIINRSFTIAWKNKSLWILGLFAGGGSSYNSDLGDLTSDTDFSNYDWSGGNPFQSFDFDPSTIALILGIVFVFGLIFMIFHLISVAGLIDAVNRIVRGGQYRLFDSISAGAKQLLKYFGLMFLMLFATIVFMFVLILIGVIGFAIHTALGVLSLIVLIPAFFLGIFVGATVYNLCQRSMAVRDNSLGDALSEAWYLFKTNTMPSAAIFILTFLFHIGFAILFMILFGLPALIFGLLTQSWLIGILVFILEFPLMLLAGAFIGTGMTNIYTLFYFELLEPGISSRPTYIPPPPAPSVGPTPA